ncbi:hypothetical protein PHMEG_00020311 [Phytophthora megakarya]|uniref:Uncharacterized protein n=1 Tax=Phytophthora megakarya TaxID=4795 RepID=A0A225VPQ9_9STRA|nr:hypothetical protein PHMEG_00020311 [Phytophthora megakarya]
MQSAWWNVWRTALYEYLPDLGTNTCHSVGNYGRASWEATGAVYKRVEAFVCGLCWFLVLLLSLILDVPMALYDVLEYLCCGSVGVFVIISVVNLLNFVFQWLTWCSYASYGIAIVGVLTHVWRRGEADGQLDRVAPRAVLSNAFESVRRDAEFR